MLTNNLKKKKQKKLYDKFQESCRWYPFTTHKNQSKIHKSDYKVENKWDKVAKKDKKKKKKIVNTTPYLFYSFISFFSIL